jgi:hypothetical protein
MKDCGKTEEIGDLLFFSNRNDAGSRRRRRRRRKVLINYKFEMMGRNSEIYMKGESKSLTLVHTC